MKRIYNKVEDYLWDDGFVKAVLCHSPLSSLYIDEAENAHQSPIMDEACNVLLAENTDLQVLPEDECLLLKNRIFKTIGL